MCDRRRPWRAAETIELHAARMETVKELREEWWASAAISHAKPFAAVAHRQPSAGGGGSSRPSSPTKEMMPHGRAGAITPDAVLARETAGTPGAKNTDRGSALRVDDAIVGKMTGYSESSFGLPPDTAFPSPQQMVGNPELTFADNSSSPDTITRSVGDWIADGFRKGQTIIVSNSAQNDGSFTIDEVSATVLTLISAYVTFLCLARMMIAENLVPFGARGKCHHEEFPYFFRMLWVYWTSLILGAPLALLLWWKWCRPQWRQHGHRVTAAITSIRRMTDFTLNPGRASRPTEGGGGARARLDAPLFGDLASQDSASVVSRPASPTRMNRSAAARANGAKKTKRPSAGATGWRGEAIRADHISQPQPEPEPEPELQLRPQPEPEPEPERGTFWGRSRAASLDTPVDDDDDDDYSSGGEDDPNWRTRNRLRARRTGRD